MYPSTVSSKKMNGNICFSVRLDGKSFFANQTGWTGFLTKLADFPECPSSFAAFLLKKPDY